MALISVNAQNNDTVPNARTMSRAEQRRLGLQNGAQDSVASVLITPELQSEVLVPKRQPFIPSSKKATLLALIPGGGQIYNRKYWKLPIIYGGFIGCTYAFLWNQQYYDDYSQAFLDIMDTNPNTNSFLDFLPPNYTLAGNEDWLKTVFKNKKNTFRRQRDLSIFAFIGVYALSIIDAYVDAELSNFDISDDITMKISPSTVRDKQFGKTAYGLQCSITF